MIRFEDCFRLLHDRLKSELIVTSAGNTSELWWEVSRETERVFYLEASMSLASLFAAGIAYGNPGKTVVAFIGDGAFNMNPGMLLVERQLDLPNLKHFMVSSRCYGSTNELTMPFSHSIDYAAMARAAGLFRVYSITSMEELERQLGEIIEVSGYTFTVLHVEPLGRHAQSPPLDGPEIKFRFGRYLERNGGRPIFDMTLP